MKTGVIQIVKNVFVIILPLLLFALPSTHIVFSQEISASQEPIKVAFTASAMGVLGILGAPLLVILGWLFSIHGRISKLEGINEGKILAKEQSPLTLTDVGATLLRDSGGKKYIEDNKETLLKKFDGVNNAFDIQERAKGLIREKIKETNGLEDIKKYLFNNGKSIDDIVLVMGLELRDVVLKYKDISVGQVDTDEVK